MAESVVRDYRISIDKADTRESSKTGAARPPQSADAME